jgi:enamine deaminase RidA (YjgF/YER057c/UK114 family)
MNGCSDLMVSVFGDAGRHARSAVDMANLPLNYAVEVDGLFELV